MIYQPPVAGRVKGILHPGPRALDVTSLANAHQLPACCSRISNVFQHMGAINEIKFCIIEGHGLHGTFIERKVSWRYGPESFRIIR
jgi:hypothetical protein